MARQKRTALEQVLADYNRWLNEVNVVTDDLRFMQKTMAEIAAKYKHHLNQVQVDFYKTLVAQRLRTMLSLSMLMEREALRVSKISRKSYPELTEERHIVYEKFREKLLLESKLNKWVKNEFSKFAAQHSVIR